MSGRPEEIRTDSESTEPHELSDATKQKDDRWHLSADDVKMFSQLEASRTEQSSDKLHPVWIRNESGEEYVKAGNGQITEFKYPGQTSPYELSYDKDGGLKGFITPGGDHFVKHGEAWGKAYKDGEWSTGNISQQDLRFDEHGFHTGNNELRYFMKLPLQVLNDHQAKRNENGDIFTKNYADKIDQFQYKGDAGPYMIHQHFQDGSIESLSTPSGDLFDYENGGWYKRHWEDKNNPYEDAQITGPWKGIDLTIGEGGFNKAGLAMLKGTLPTDR